MTASLEQVLAFLDRLDDAQLAYDLKHVRDSLMVVVYVAEGYCETEPSK